MSKLQTLSEPVNQTSFAKAVRLGTESVLDALATVGQQSRDHMEMAHRWYLAAEKYCDDSPQERGVLMGLSEMASRVSLAFALTHGG
jgi:hypothetical protein